MLFDQRIIFDDNGTKSDISIQLNDFRTQSVGFVYVAAQDALYIGSELPFNHRYFDLSTVNTNASIPSVSIWFANQWHPAVDIIDYTALAGASLGQPGIIKWSTNRLKGWDRELDSDDVTGLENTVVYNFYWIKVTWSATFSAGTALSYIGHRFTVDDYLYSYYPDLQQASLLTAFEAGKTSWKEQEFMASETIIRDMKKNNIVVSSSQVIHYEALVEPCCHKTAELIYSAFGERYKDHKKAARDAYKESFNIDKFVIDINADAMPSDYEKIKSTWFLSR